MERFSTDGKVGVGFQRFRGEKGQRLEWWRLYKHEENGTGLVHKMNKWLISEREREREREELTKKRGFENLDRWRTLPLLTIQFRIWCRGVALIPELCPGPASTTGTRVIQGC